MRVRPVPQTDTGGQVEHTKVSERTVAKELGNIAPYVRKKERSVIQSRSEEAQATV